MLVWKAMLSMVPMITAIFSELAVMRPMVSTTCPITSPLSDTARDASPLSRLAWRAFSAFWPTVAVISSMLEAVCCSEAACCSEREDRSSLPWAISRAAGVTTSMPRFTSPTMLPRLRRISFRPITSSPISPLRRRGGLAARLPAAICSVNMPASRTGPSTERAVAQNSSASSGRPTAAKAIKAVDNGAASPRPRKPITPAPSSGAALAR